MFFFQMHSLLSILVDDAIAAGDVLLAFRRAMNNEIRQGRIDIRAPLPPDPDYDGSPLQLFEETNTILFYETKDSESHWGKVSLSRQCFLHFATSLMWQPNSLGAMTKKNYLVPRWYTIRNKSSKNKSLNFLRFNARIMIPFGYVPFSIYEFVLPTVVSLFVCMIRL